MKVAIAAAMLMIAMPGANLASAQTPQERIDTALARAREAGIAVVLLESKIAEGKAKGVSMERIAAVIERREAALGRASQAMRGRPDVTSGDLSVAADALESGVSDAVLRTIAGTAARDRRAVAIAALTQLVELGHVPESALERVREALNRGPEALLNLPAQAGAAPGRRGAAPAAGPDAPGRGGAEAAPPAAVPAPGNSPKPARPGGPPGTTGRPTTGPSAGRGGADGR